MHYAYAESVFKYNANFIKNLGFYHIDKLRFYELKFDFISKWEWRIVVTL